MKRSKEWSSLHGLFDQTLEIEGHTLSCLVANITFCFCCDDFWGPFFLFEVYGEDHVCFYCTLPYVVQRNLQCDNLALNRVNAVFPSVFFSCSVCFIFTSSHFHLVFIYLHCGAGWLGMYLLCFYFWNFFELPQIAAELL